MDYVDIQDAIVRGSVPNVPFDGWSTKALRLGAESAGLDAEAAERAFPGGPSEAVLHFVDLSDRLMIQAMAEEETEGMRLAERVLLAIRLRLEPWERDREAVRRGLALLAMPANAPAALRASYRTVDSIWYAAGDTSVDFSFYTKRAELAGIYGATLLVWLEDTSEGSATTWDFLTRRLEEMVRLKKSQAKLRDSLSKLPNPLSLATRPFSVARGMRMR